MVALSLHIHLEIRLQNRLHLNLNAESSLIGPSKLTVCNGDAAVHVCV